MSHYVKSLKIQNFRSCQVLELDLSNFVPIVGYNNAGKSNILSALEWLFKNRLLNAGEFCNPDEPIEVEGEIIGVTDEILERLEDRHKASILPYITNNSIKIKRTQLPNTRKATDVTLNVFHPSHGYRPNPTGIWNAIKQLFPEPIRVSAMDNAADDSAKSKSTSTIGKLLSELCNSVNEQNLRKIDLHLSAITRRMAADGDKRLEELNDIDESINEKIDNLFPGLRLKLHFEVPNFEEIFKSGTVRVYDEAGIGRDFTSYGHGAQRSIQMALIRHLAEVKKESESPTTTLLLIDEPELYLHPFAIEQVREALHALSENGYQVLFSTHSAQMITADRAQHTLLIRKITGQGTCARKRLKDALEKVLPNTTAQTQHLFSLSQLTQILFSNKVILTEGKTELRLLPYLYKKISSNTLGQHNVALIETGSVDSIYKTLQILREMDIPAIAIVDLDYAFRGAIKNGFIAEENESILALKSLLLELEKNKECKLATDGLPTNKDSPISAAKAFELLAQQTNAVGHIDKIHKLLAENGIWLWKGGAIEAHLGLSAKSESAWAEFKTKIDSDGLEVHCLDFAGVNALIQWMRQ